MKAFMYTREPYQVLHFIIHIVANQASGGDCGAGSWQTRYLGVICSSDVSLDDVDDNKCSSDVHRAAAAATKKEKM